MIQDEPSVKKKDGAERAGTALPLENLPPKDEKAERVTVRKEKKKLKRVVKSGSEGMRHASDCRQPLSITEKKQGPEFDKDHAEKLRMNEQAEEFLKKEGGPCIHFDAESGTINLLGDDERNPALMKECGNCGTSIQFDADSCPICGRKLDVVDSGIVGLLTDAKFEDDNSEDMDCPLCGEHVVLIDGRCPTCGETIRGSDPTEALEMIDPVIHNDNVVFLHLDVESGELNCLQKLANRLGFEKLTVHLEGVGAVGFDRDGRTPSSV